MKLVKVLKKHYTVIPHGPNKKMDSFKCNYCVQEYAYHITRMSNHLKECRGSPANVKQLIESSGPPKKKSKDSNKRKRESSSSDSSENEMDRERDPLNPIEENGQNAKKAKISKIDEFVDKMSNPNQKQCQELLAKAIYASGCPLSITTNVYWQKFFNAVKPSFEIPTRHDLSNKLLEETFNNVRARVNKKIEDSTSLALQCDAWSNIRNEGIINFILNTPEPVFYKTIETKTESQNGEYLVSQISDVIEAVQPEKIMGVCTDNAAVCKKSWKILEKKYQDDMISFYGCAAHIFNLLAKDISDLPSAKDVLKGSTTIVNEIKKSHILLAHFNELQNSGPISERVTISLKIPVQTRWSSHLLCLDSLHVNKPNLQQLAISKIGDKLNKSTKQLILDEEFWIKIKKLIQILQPISINIKKLEGDESVFSEVPCMFDTLKQHLDQEFKNHLSIFTFDEMHKILCSLEERKKMTLRPVHYSANILDPRFKGKHLEYDEFSAGSDFISRLAAKFDLDKNAVLVDLMEYNSDDGLWGKDYVKESAALSTPVKWWKGACKTSRLSKIAVAILQLPCTSAATERSFSAYGWIHNSKGNKLKAERAGKITYISHNLKLLDKEPKAIKSKSEEESDDESVVPEDQLVRRVEHDFSIDDVENLDLDKDHSNDHLQDEEFETMDKQINSNMEEVESNVDSQSTDNNLVMYLSNEKNKYVPIRIIN